MLKAVGIFLIFSAISSLGFLYSASLKQRARMLYEMSRFAEECESEIRYLQTDVFAIISSAAENDAYSDLGFLKNLAGRRQDWGKTAIEECIKLPRAADAEMVRGYFLGLGKSDCNGQISHCRGYKELFEAEACRAGKDCENRGRLFRSLFIFAAAGAVVLLI